MSYEFDLADLFDISTVKACWMCLLILFNPKTIDLHDIANGHMFVVGLVHSSLRFSILRSILDIFWSPLLGYLVDFVYFLNL